MSVLIAKLRLLYCIQLRGVIVKLYAQNLFGIIHEIRMQTATSLAHVGWFGAFLKIFKWSMFRERLERTQNQKCTQNSKKLLPCVWGKVYIVVSFTVYARV